MIQEILQHIKNINKNIKKLMELRLPPIRVVEGNDLSRAGLRSAMRIGKRRIGSEADENDDT
jgi:hypothetical protein